MEILSTNLIYGSIYNIIKFYILNKDGLDIEKQRANYQGNDSSLDNAAIFLRILTKHIQYISDDYLKKHEELKNISSLIENNGKKAIDLEKEINSVLEVKELQNSGLDLGIEKMLIPVKHTFLDDKLDNLENLEINLKNLEKFHTTLLSNYGRYVGDLNSDSLGVKSGSMFQYFELSNLLLDKTSEVLESLKSYKRCSEEKEKFDNNLNKVSNDIVIDLGKVYSLDDELLSKVIDDALAKSLNVIF